MNRLSELRKSKQLSQKQFSIIIGVAQNTVSNWENGNRLIDTETVKNIADFFGVSTDYLLGRETPDIFSFDNIMPIEQKKIPLLGEIACGEPIFANEDFESYIECGTNIKADFALKCKGDSMINARIFDGDIVFIRKQSDVDNGEIAAVIIDDTATLKRVYKGNNRITLMAENKDYEPFTYVGEELNHINILGKAIAFQSDVK